VNKDTTRFKGEFSQLLLPSSYSYPTVTSRMTLFLSVFFVSNSAHAMTSQIKGRREQRWGLIGDGTEARATRSLEVKGGTSLND
jgi:hypothetical protein